MTLARRVGRSLPKPAMLALLLFCLLGSGPALAVRADPMGFWMTEDNSAMVDIVACGPMICGTIVWSDKPVDAKGRPLCRRAILGDILKTGPASWGKGWIYAPRTDTKYPVAFSLEPDGSLAVHVTAGLFGKDQKWTRPAQPPTLCTQ